MAEEMSELQTWDDVIIDFLAGKKSAEEEKYIKDEVKKIAEIYKRQNYYGEESIAVLFDPKKSKKEKSQLAVDFQREKLQEILLLEQKPEDLDVTKLSEDYARKCADIENKYAASGWITKAAKDATSVSFATHVAKLTHSKIDSPSLYDSVISVKTDIITTASLTEKAIDGAVAGNQFAPVFQFLELELNGRKLAAEFANDSCQALHFFAKDGQELALWNANFKNVLAGDSPSTHALAKQVYFPILLNKTNESDSYHLLCHMKSSSLAHAIYNKVFDESQKAPKDLRSKGKYSEYPVFSFVANARLSVTASNHSNASQLNGKRGGKLHLFSTQPPTWQSQLKPPLYKKSLFDNFSHPSIKLEVDYLREYLLRFERIELSVKNPHRRKWIEKWVANIIDELLNYAATIQALPAGWSDTENSKLKLEHQYFLDPHRDDEAFQNLRKGSGWQSVICSDFSQWLNRRLVGKDKKFTPQAEHTRLWASLLEDPLREYNEMIEASSKHYLLKEEV
ncbi:MAG: type I-F CRISPR-associated protein Csy1 [Methyloprofundus sp.]|nr:type I-F CRISPR-associated protein Csy1 [Methyloprofundus sp.]MBW6453090.1 type I-F CRISPR-associated protein Csy1 [Methyloprofundus sp.]